MLSGTILSLVAFENIEKSVSTVSIRAWAAEEEHAKKERIHDVTAMDIYDIKMERREFDHSILILLDNWLQSLLEQKYFLN